ncbi:phosphonate C-P lyase system protein PhnH [Rhizobium sp.]
MTNALVPTADDSRTNTTFEEMMWALSRPGLIRNLPVAGLASVAESLLDNECSFHAIDDAAFAMEISRMGARSASLPDAQYVFGALDTASGVSALSELRVGSLSYPDDGATLFASARLGFGTGLRLTGPGVKDSISIAIDGIDPSFWSLREKLIRYPLGFDLFLVDGNQIVGIPRSTKLEVL